MKTLKKTLCLVLAVVMVVGVLVLPANAAATTTEDTDATAAFNTLFGYGVMQGVDANNTPGLSKNINRQDMAAIVYRIMTGDTEGKYKDNYVGTADKFADSATFATWAKGYIGYVRNQGIFVGDNNGNFKPTDNITGDEVLTVLLRCIGYGQNGEFTGASWAENAETQATQIHLFGNATGYKDVKADMSKVISRGIVAKLTYNAVKAPMVTYYNGAYSDSTVDGRPVAPNVAGTLNPSLITAKEVVEEKTFDKWGAPTFKSYDEVSFNYPQVKIVSERNEKPVVAKGEYWTPVTECEASTDGGVTTSANLEVYENGYKQPNKIQIQATDTVDTIGAQGRWTRTFDVDGNGVIDRVVYIDTLLAQVRKVNPQVTDLRGHVVSEANTELHVYYTGETAVSTATNYVIKGNDFARGEYILLFALTTNGVTPKTGANYVADYYETKGVATSITGAQTTRWTNAKSHVIENATYSDNNRYHLDVAGDTLYNVFVWFKDLKGNVIGSVTPAAAPNSYAILTSMIWKTGNPGHAEATLLYMDGTTATVTVAAMDADDEDNTANFGGTWQSTTTNKLIAPMATDAASSTTVEIEADGSAPDYAYVSDEGRYNGMYQGYALYTVSTNSNGSVNLSKTNYLATSSAKVKNKGTTLNTSGTNVYVDDATVFIVRKGNGTTIPFSYDRYVGKDNVPSFNDSTVSLFYVDNDVDNVAEYVYINAGTQTAASMSRFVAALSNKYSRHVIDDVNAWALDSAFVGDAIAPSATIYATDKLDNIYEMANHVNELYFVTYISGAVTAIKPIDVAGVDTTTGDSGSSMSASNGAVFMLTNVTYTDGLGTLIATYGSGTSYSQSKLVVGKSWDINDPSVKVYGKTKDQLKDIVWSAVNAYAVLSAPTSGNDNGNRNLLSLYIFDKPVEGNPSVPTPGSLDYTVTIDGTSIKVAYRTASYASNPGTTPTDSQYIAMILGKLTAEGYTGLGVESISGGYQFTGTKATAGVPVEYKFTFVKASDATGSVLVNLNGTDTLLTTSTHGTIATLIDNAGAGVYVYAKSKTESALTLKAATTTLSDGDTIVTTKKYAQVNETVSISAGSVSASTDTNQSGATLSYAAAFVNDPENTIWVTSGSNKYLELGKDYSLKITITSNTASTNIQTGRKIVVDVAGSGLITATEDLVWGVENDPIAEAPGTPKTVTFALTNSTLSSITGQISISVTVDGDTYSA